MRRRISIQEHSPQPDRAIPKAVRAELDALARKVWPGARVRNVWGDGEVLSVVTGSDEEDTCRDELVMDTTMPPEAAVIAFRGALRALRRARVSVVPSRRNPHRPNR